MASSWGSVLRPAVASEERSGMRSTSAEEEASRMPSAFTDDDEPPPTAAATSAAAMAISSVRLSQEARIEAKSPQLESRSLAVVDFE